jgi:hypothetical protein
MLRKGYGSLPRVHDLPRDARRISRCKVHCRLEMEARRLRVDPAMLMPTFSPPELAETARRLYEESLEGVPRFARALQEFSAQHLIETIVEGLLQLTSDEIEGFSVCPLVTESIRCVPRDHGTTDVAVMFRAALLTYFTDQESAVAVAHEGHRELYRTYYEEILVRYATRRMEELLDPVRAARLDQLEAHTAETLGQALSELRRLFPLEPFQQEYENGPSSSDQKASLVRTICRDMKLEAKRRIGL